MRTRVITPPTTEPLTVAEVRMHLRNPEITTNDAELIWFIQAAREMVENKLQRKLLTQTLETTFDSFPPGYDCGRYGYWDSLIDLPYPPLQSVTSITYIDENEAAQTLATSEYRVDTTGDFGRIRLAYGATWPNTLYDQNTVTIRYVVGWTNPAQIPPGIKAYMKLMIEALDKNRSIMQEREPFLTPFAERLLDPHRVLTVA